MLLIIIGPAFPGHNIKCKLIEHGANHTALDIEIILRLKLEELYNSCFSPNIRVIKSKKLRWIEHVTWKGRAEKLHILVRKS